MDNAALSNIASSASTPGFYSQTISLSGPGSSTTAPPPPATVPITDGETIRLTDADAFADVADSETIKLIDQDTITVGGGATLTFPLVALKTKERIGDVVAADGSPKPRLP